jgi:hypothetical protein
MRGGREIDAGLSLRRQVKIDVDAVKDKSHVAA